MDLLTPSGTRTFAYKGEASYWSAAVGGDAYKVVAWSCEDRGRQRATRPARG